MTYVFIHEDNKTGLSCMNKWMLSLDDVKAEEDWWPMPRSLQVGAKVASGETELSNFLNVCLLAVVNFAEGSSQNNDELTSTKIFTRITPH